MGIFNSVAPFQPQYDPSTSGLINKQSSDAQSYQSNIPATEQSAYNQYADQAKNQLAAQVAQLKQQNSNRGMLYSGINQGQQSDAYGNAAQQAAQAQYGINQNVNANAQGMLNNAANSGLGYQGQQMGVQNSAYNMALGQAQQNQGAANALAGGIGKVAGVALAGNSSSGGTNYNPGTGTYSVNPGSGGYAVNQASPYSSSSLQAQLDAMQQPAN